MYLFYFFSNYFYFLLTSSGRLASGEGIVAFGVRLSRCVCLSVCLSAEPRLHVRRISLGGEGNALYPALSSFLTLPFL